MICKAFTYLLIKTTALTSESPRHARQGDEGVGLRVLGVGLSRTHKSGRDGQITLFSEQ